MGQHELEWGSIHSNDQSNVVVGCDWPFSHVLIINKILWLVGCCWFSVVEDCLLVMVKRSWLYWWSTQCRCRLSIVGCGWMLLIVLVINSKLYDVSCGWTLFVTSIINQAFLLVVCCWLYWWSIQCSCYLFVVDCGWPLLVVLTTNQMLLPVGCCFFFFFLSLVVLMIYSYYWLYWWSTQLFCRLVVDCINDQSNVVVRCMLLAEAEHCWLYQSSIKHCCCLTVVGCIKDQSNVIGWSLLVFGCIGDYWCSCHACRPAISGSYKTDTESVGGEPCK
jgi:hypothetical protein